MQKAFSLTRPKHGIIGHRGVAALAPENTWAGFVLAAEQGFDWIEFDIQLTKDNAIVIFHDDTLERTTNGSGKLFEKTAEELKNLDAGSWFHSDFRGERLPGFSALLPALLSLPLTLNIELKYPENPSPNHITTLAALLADTLQSQWPATRPLPLLSSFHWEALHHIHTLLPEAPLGFLTEHCSLAAIAHVKPFANAALHCDYRSLTPALIAEAHKNAVPLLAYTVNDPEIAATLLKAGLFGLFSDKPAYMLNCEHLI